MIINAAFISFAVSTYLYAFLRVVFEIETLNKKVKILRSLHRVVLIYFFIFFFAYFIFLCTIRSQLKLNYLMKNT